tara:strand:- start:2467 stop:2973 length:507 start_codon:yes stop_codon:yes gene_type:complete
MSDQSEIFLIIFGAIGWLLSLYFGFFRFKQYVWAKSKVQYDLFTRINQKSNNLFLKATTLIPIQGKSEKVSAKIEGVWIKYLENFTEKVFLMRCEMAPKEIALFWVNGTINELQVFALQDKAVLTKLRNLSEQSCIISPSTIALFDFADSDTPITAERLEALYLELMK